MASAVEIVDELMTEFGKTTSKVRQELEQYVGDITVDLLSQHQGRFPELQQNIIITLEADEASYRLPADYGTISKTVFEVDSDGNPSSTKISVETEQTAMERRYAKEYAGARIAWVSFLKGGRSGRGWYFILATAPETAGALYKIFYYRKATTADTDLIRNEEIVKTGVRARYHMQRNDPYSQALLTTYERMKSGFKPEVQRHKTRIGITLNPRARELTALQWDIGEGN